MDEIAPCLGKWALFDSEDADDHAEAKALCDACPVFVWCAEELKRAQSDALYQGHGPAGTWAGQYVGKKGRTTHPRRRVAKCGTPGGYKKHYREGTPYCEACREAVRLAKKRLKEEAAAS